MSTKTSNRVKTEQGKVPQLSWSQTLMRIQTDQLSIDGIIELADQLQKSGQLDKLDQAYETWISKSSSPHKFVACFNYGVLLANNGRDADAIKYYNLAIQQNPTFAHPRINLGLAYERQGNVQEAINQWSRITDDTTVRQVAPIDIQTTAKNHIGRLKEINRDYGNAESALEESLLLDPKQKDALHHWFHLRQRQCKWPAVKEFGNVTQNDIVKSMSPLAALAFDDDLAFQMYVAEKIVRDKFTFPVQALSTKGHNYQHKRIRVGYLSGDLCTHAVGLLLPEIFELHDRSRFEIYAYDYSKEDGTLLRERIKAAIENFVPIQDMTDLQAAQKIRSDEIDILVDLHGLSQGLRAGILAFKPAPIQMTYIGYIGTTMMPYIDYVITDRYCFTENMRPYFSEEPLYLDNCCIPTDRKKIVDPTPTRESVGLPVDKFIFSSFNNAYKLNPKMFACWMRIIKRVPNSVLWIVDDNPAATENLKKFALENGVEPSRLIFTPRVLPSLYLARMPLSDIFLDNFPYNAGSTASDIMWMGTPMITLSGKTFVSRMAGSMLHHSGLDYLIAENYDNYENLAVALASRPDKLVEIKARMLAQREQNGAFDMLKFTKSLEDNFVNSLQKSIV